jgi:hypothetical protein
MRGASPPLPHYAFMTWCLVKKSTAAALLFFPLASTVLIGPWPSLMDFSTHRHLVGLLGWGISPTQGLYRHRTTQHNTKTRRHTSMLRAGFEPAISMFKRSYTVPASDRSAIETDEPCRVLLFIIFILFVHNLFCVQNGSGAHPAPIQWVPGALSLGVKRPGREADHSPPSSAEAKECVELYLHSPNTPSWCGA